MYQPFYILGFVTDYGQICAIIEDPENNLLETCSIDELKIQNWEESHLNKNIHLHHTNLK
jgi:hypothetical protein